MTQFDPSMVAQMLMQPIQRASENLGGAPFGIGADAGGSYFVDPEVAARTGYGTAVTGTSFFPGAGIVDAAGGAVDVTGQPLPSFSENIREGQFTDAGLQALGVAGDIATIAAPLTGGATALLGAMMKAPGAARKVTKATDVASDVAGIAKVEPPTETQPGIIAFHGSGADFDEFKLEYINTGEGNQAFGFGLYFTDSEDIGKFYKQKLTGSSFKTKDGKIFDPYTMDNDGKRTIQNPNIRTSISQSDGDIDKPIARAEKIIANMPNTQASELAEKDLVILNDLKAKGGLTVNKGKTYKVAIQPKPEELLDYDKPLSEQPKILEKIENLAAVKTLREEGVNAFSPDEIASFFELNQIEKFDGQEFLRFLEDAKTTSGKDVVSKELNNVGIKGIKYKAGQISGIKDSEATNFVIFDDQIINILEKYGIVGPVAVSATAAALRDDDGST